MKKLISVILVVMTVLVLVSCTSSQTSGNITDDIQSKVIDVTDFAGNKYTLTSAPSGICCVSPIAAEILDELGFSRVIKAANDTVIATSAVPMTVQQVALDELLPANLTMIGVDFFVYEDGISEDLLNAVKAQNIRLFKLASTGGVDTAYSNIRIISSLMFKPDSGEDIIDDMRDQINLVKTMAANKTKKSTFYAEQGIPEDIYAIGNGTLISELMTLCGGENVFSDKEEVFKVTNAEVVEKNPELMISFVHGEKFGVTTIRSRVGYDSTEASKMGRIFVFDHTIPIRPSPSLIDALFEISYLMDTMPRPVVTSPDTTSTAKE